MSPSMPSRPAAISEPDGPLNRIVVGIGEFAVSDRPSDVIVTHALGSCIAVCVFDPERQVAGMLHFLLPESRINPQRALEQPAAFADTGIPLLFQAAYKLGAEKTRCRVSLIGGAEVAAHHTAGPCVFNIGRRNQLAAKNTLWRNGVLIDREDTGGKTIRTVHLWVADGRLQISGGRGTPSQA
jgi:chemotaxis protein CheD